MRVQVIPRVLIENVTFLYVHNLCLCQVGHEISQSLVHRISQLALLRGSVFTKTQYAKRTLNSRSISRTPEVGEHQALS